MSTSAWGNAFGLAFGDSWGIVIGTSITNDNASTTDHNTNIEFCDHTNFKQYPGALVKDAYAGFTRKKSYDSQHPQELVKSVADSQPGSVSPEQPNTFVTTPTEPGDL